MTNEEEAIKILKNDISLLISSIVDGSEESIAKATRYDKVINLAIKALDTIPEQPDICPIYGGVCGYPIEACSECPKHGVVEKMLEQLEQQPRWIPVSERLPEESGDYLVTICSGGEYYDVDTSYFCFLDEGGTEWLESGVIAWQPLPEPYKEDKE